MHVLFIAPETHTYNHEFIRGLKETGCFVSGVGHAPLARLAAPLAHLLDAYESVRNLLDLAELRRASEIIGRKKTIDRVETIDEPMVLPAAQLRQALALPGLTVKTATLCRDKSAMKEFLRSEGVPCAEAAAVSTAPEVLAFAERIGYPLILKPRAGFGSLGTYKVTQRRELDAALQKMRFGTGGSIAVEEFIDGHEGFYDTITVDGRVEHDFISHYYPGCLEALQRREVSPQIAHTNRIDSSSYSELRLLGQRVNRLLGIDRSATHMEWFFGDKGLKFSEIGARPAGEKIWDLYRVANDVDIYREWALAVSQGRVEASLTRRYATGSIQVRPDRDGVVVGHRGLDEIRRRFGSSIYESSIPEPGTRTFPLEKGWLVNTWFRLRHENYDTVREAMDAIGQTVRCFAR